MNPCLYWRPCSCAHCLPELHCYSCGQPQVEHAHGEHRTDEGPPCGICGQPLPYESSTELRFHVGCKEAARAAALVAVVNQLCGERLIDTTVVCERAMGHAKDHRGQSRIGLHSWGWVPEAAPVAVEDGNATIPEAVLSNADLVFGSREGQT